MGGAAAFFVLFGLNHWPGSVKDTTPATHVRCDIQAAEYNATPSVIPKVQCLRCCSAPS